MNRHLRWLPEIDSAASYKSRLAAVGPDGWPTGVALANHKLDFIRTAQLDSVIRSAIGADMPANLAAKPVRLAILGSCTMAQLHPAIRVAGLRRNIHITIYEADFGQYWQELANSDSGLHAFGPTAILLALDAHHLAAGVNAAMTAPQVDAALQETVSRIRECWRLARETFHCSVIHQAPLPVHPPLLGNNEHRLAGSKAAFVARLNSALRLTADEAGVELLALDDRAAADGLAAWHDVGLWHRAKQEVSLAAAPMYGEFLVRILAAKLGRSHKCLVLDLDNTLWGGVIGDDGIAGIVLGQGSPLGEAYAAFQDYCRELSRRGVILAVCSKNDEANALEPFDKHPEMVLQRGDIACFVANWADKAANIRAIAEQLNIGLDSMVFVDDNPFERTLVRESLPMVAVPEVGDDPADFAGILSDAGYFEAVTVTREDRERSGQYQGNQLREQLRASTTDLPSYLKSLDMRLAWRQFDKVGLSRIVQLINKTNQFNLTTRRHTEADILAVMADERSFGLQLRLVDRFGDNGIIAIVIGRLQADDLVLDTWLMSCRVLGRQVEAATLNLVAAEARKLGRARLVGLYVPAAKNMMVRDHYEKLGFTVVERDEAGGSRAVLDLAAFTPAETFIDVWEG
jgi:FkbH-like protein